MAEWEQEATSLKRQISSSEPVAHSEQHAGHVCASQREETPVQSQLLCPEEFQKMDLKQLKERRRNINTLMKLTQPSPEEYVTLRGRLAAVNAEIQTKQSTQGSHSDVESPSCGDVNNSSFGSVASGTGLCTPAVGKEEKQENSTSQDLEAMSSKKNEPCLGRGRSTDMARGPPGPGKDQMDSTRHGRPFVDEAQPGSSRTANHTPTLSSTPSNVDSTTPIATSTSASNAQSSSDPSLSVSLPLSPVLHL
jgi:hypothetical protein